MPWCGAGRREAASSVAPISTPISALPAYLPHVPRHPPPTGDHREMSRCLFCTLVAEGDHVHKADGFVAIRDLHPLAETHLLVLPERHVDTFKDVAAFSPEESAQ